MCARAAWGAGGAAWGGRCGRRASGPTLLPLDLFSWTDRGKGLLLLNVLVLLCASNWVIVKQAEAALPTPAAFTALRFAVAAAAFAPFLPRASPAVLVAGVELGVWSAAGYIFQAVGLETCDASRASFLSAFTVVVVPLLQGLTGARVPDKFEAQPQAFFEKVIAGYARRAAQAPQRFARIHADQTPEAVRAEVLAALRTHGLLPA